MTNHSESPAPNSELCFEMPKMHRSKGVSLIEVLIGILIVVIASIGTLTYFAQGFGSVNKTGNRRAALERARERLEQLMEASASQLPSQDGQLYWCNSPDTTGAPCTSWQASGTPVAQVVPVDNLTNNQRMETSVQMIDDPDAGTAATLDTLALSVKVWFIPGSTDDDNFHRVYVRTLRTP